MLWTSSEGREERLKRLRAGLKTYADAGVYGRLTYSFVGSLLSLGAVGGIDEDVGPELLPANNRAEVLSETFDAVYQQVGGGRWVGGQRGRGHYLMQACAGAVHHHDMLAWHL